MKKLLLMMSLLSVSILYASENDRKGYGRIVEKVSDAKTGDFCYLYSIYNFDTKSLIKNHKVLYVGHKEINKTTGQLDIHETYYVVPRSRDMQNHTLPDGCVKFDTLSSAVAYMSQHDQQSKL